MLHTIQATQEHATSPRFVVVEAARAGRATRRRAWCMLGALGVVTSAAVAAAAPTSVSTARRAHVPSSSIAQAEPDGAALYAQHCSSCHGNEKKGQPAANTKKAIDEDMGKMGALKFLTPAELAAIAATH